MSAMPAMGSGFPIPENAPFTAEQRVWLSGFFSAVLAETGAGAPSPAAGADSGGPELADNDLAPWHDPAMPLGERMELAQGRPLAPRLMAAMAQQDCGQCGYNCADYANAIFLKGEERLNLCVPGGKETARAVKALSAEIGHAPPAAPTGDGSSAIGASPAPAGPLPFGRDNPSTAVFLGRRLLNGPGSEKETWHLDFDLSGSGLDYAAGDSFGIFPHNDLGLVDQIVATLGASHATPVRGRTLRAVLGDEVSIGLAPDTLFELFSFVTGGPARAKARALARGEDPDGDAAHLDVLAVLHKFAGVRPHPEAFVDALEPLQPRLYSISSSPKNEPGRLSLTVDTVRYLVNKRRRLGVASTYFAERTEPGERFRAYVQPLHGFRPPAEGAAPAIMIGPGTGIAPFRAFLHERRATGATGRNWLFFGHQRQASDFFYREELDAMKASGLLTRLSLAWSRDAGEKFYVQDRMREVGAELWRWLADGAYLYVCGDAKRMAKDVEAALVDIVSVHGVRTTDEAVAFVSILKKSGRYAADVY